MPILLYKHTVSTIS